MNNRLREIGGFLVGVGIAAVVLLLIYVLIEIRHTQQEGSPTLQAISDQQDDIERGTTAAVDTNEKLLDCLTPGGRCYRQAKEGNQASIGSINEITYLAAACADQAGTQTVEEIQKCVIEGLSHSHH